MTYINEGYEVGGIEINPTEVDITGAKSLVDTVAYVQIMLSEDKLQEEPSTVQCSTKALDIDGNAVQGVRLSSAYVEVTASLYSTKTVALQVPVEGTLADNVDMISQNIPQSIGNKRTRRNSSKYTKNYRKPYPSTKFNRRCDDSDCSYSSRGN